MFRIALFAIAVSLIAITMNAGVAQAQPTRVSVAAQGLDSNPCTFALPCRTFQHAHDVVASNGEIDVLDPAGYGVLTINKAISIQGHGFSGITATSGNAITINAGVGDKINLRGLIIEGAGLGSNGIVFNTGASLTIDDSVIRGNVANGLRFGPNASSTLTVLRSLIADNFAGVTVAPTGSGAANVVLNRINVHNNPTWGLYVTGANSTGTVQVDVTDSAISSSTNTGIQAVSPLFQAKVIVSVTRSTLTNHNIGILLDGPMVALWLSESVITGNSNGWRVFANAQFRSYQDNTIDGNTANEAAPPTVAKK
jgi:hypothetical protein